MDINFSVVDPRNENHHSLIASKIIWHAGSLESFQSAFLSGPSITAGGLTNKDLLDIGIIIQLGISISLSVLAVVAQFKKTELFAKIAATAVIVTNIVMMFIGYGVFIENSDPGALLGSALHGFITMMNYFITMSICRIIRSTGTIFLNVLENKGWFEYIRKGAVWVSRIILVLNVVYLLFQTISNPWKAFYFLPILATTVGALTSSGGLQKFFGISTLIFSALNFILPLLGILFFSGQDNFLNPSDPDPNELDVWIHTFPLPIISWFISSSFLGGLLGILSLAKGQGTRDKGQGFFTSLVNTFLGLTVVCSLMYLFSFMWKSQFFYLLEYLGYTFKFGPATK